MWMCGCTGQAVGHDWRVYDVGGQRSLVCFFSSVLFLVFAPTPPFPPFFLTQILILILTFGIFSLCYSEVSRILQTAISTFLERR